MKIPCKEILRKILEEDFEKIWEKYSKRIPEDGIVRFPTGKGCESDVMKFLIKIREAFLELGFEEVINPIIIDESEVYKQYGPEAPIILDRIYYLAGLPRPDIGIRKDVIEKIKREVKDIDFEELKEILREYREGRIDADELIENFKERLKIGDDKALKILRTFESFFKLKPEPTSLTLRSHMTAAWFPTIMEILRYRFPPLYLFSIDWVFRREQRVDESHLRYYHSISCVIVDENLNVKYAFEITKKIIEKIEEKIGKKFEGIEIKKRKDTARYYAKDKEWEVFAFFDKKWYEIGTFGFYNPVSLAKYGIEYPVYNFGIGLERLLQVVLGEKDIRRILFPYRYPIFDDKLIYQSVRIAKEPRTEWGKMLYEVLMKKVEEFRERIGPFRELTYEDEKVKVYFLEPDEGKRFLGPAAFNKVYIKDLSIISTTKEIDGICLGNYIELIMKRVVWEIENGKEGLIKIRWVNGPSDINIEIHSNILGKLKKIDIKGPVFLDIYVKRR